MAAMLTAAIVSWASPESDSLYGEAYSFEAIEDGDGTHDGISINGVSISMEDTTVKVTGAKGMTLEVVSLTGLTVKKVAIDSQTKSITLDLPKGCYIIKVGKMVRKIAVR